jgi:hypothetical protein
MHPLASLSVCACLSVGLSVLMSRYNDSGAAEPIIVKFYVHCNIDC